MCLYHHFALEMRAQSSTGQIFVVLTTCQQFELQTFNHLKVVATTSFRELLMVA